MIVVEDIKVSIIVPIFNKEKYLPKCLDTITHQTLKEIEIILVDDGSTDDSKRICDEFLSDSRIQYYYQKNEGLASARQTGMDHSHGEYIGFIDGDDWIELNMFEKMYAVAKEYDVDVVYCNRRDNEDGPLASKEIPSGLYNRKEILADILPKSLAYVGKYGNKQSISWSNCRRIFRKKLLDDNGIRFDKRFRRSQDLMLTYEAMLCAQRFYHLGDDYFYHTRIVEDSLSRGYTKNMWNLYVPLIERLYKDTEDFTEADLMPEMHLRAFYFVTDCIENEMKPTCPNDMNTRIRLVQEVINHPICDRYFGQIPIEKMNPLYQQYYRLIHEKNANGVFVAKRRYDNKIRRKQKYINPVINFMTENRITGTVYKKIRKKS